MVNQIEVFQKEKLNQIKPVKTCELDVKCQRSNRKQRTYWVEIVVAFKLNNHFFELKLSFMIINFVDNIESHGKTKLISWRRKNKGK